MVDKPFIRITHDGQVTWAAFYDRRIWPWLVATWLARAAHAQNEQHRQFCLIQAEWMATHRRYRYMSGSIGTMTGMAKDIVTACDICGKRALRLSGFHGRCRQHQGVVAADERRYAQSKDAAQLAIAGTHLDQDRVLRARDKLHPPKGRFHMERPGGISKHHVGMTRGRWSSKS